MDSWEAVFGIDDSVYFEPPVVEMEEVLQPEKLSDNSRGMSECDVVFFSCLMSVILFFIRLVSFPCCSTSFHFTPV